MQQIQQINIRQGDKIIMAHIKILYKHVQCHIWSRILFRIFIGLFIAIIFFFTMWRLCQELSYDYLVDSNAIIESEKNDIDSLQKYVDINQIAATNVFQMQNWCIKNNIRYMCIERNNILLFDMGYTSLLNTFNGGIVSAIRPFSRTVKFSDGNADVYIDTGIINFFFTASIIIPAFAASIIWICIFWKGVKKILRQILIINNAVDKYANGNLSAPIVIHGSDEFSHLADSLNCMRTSLIEEEKKNKTLQESQNELMVGMSHDLRTPLTSMMNYIEIIHQKAEPEATDTYLEKLEAKVIQLRDLSDKLFQYFLLQKDSPVILNDPEPAATIIGDYLSEFCAMLTDDGFHVRMDSADFGNGKVTVSDEFMGRINSNIISNIEKYAVPESDIHIKIISPETELILRIINQRAAKYPTNEGSGIGIKNVELMMKKMGGYCRIKKTSYTFAISLHFPFSVKA